MESCSLFDSAHASKAEKLGVLPVEWLEAIYREKWFKLFVPEDMGGLNRTLPEALVIEERLARLDGSLGWTVTLCAGAGWFVGFMEESLRKETFPDEKLCLAGSGFVGGKADKIGGQYHVSGSWNYASGIRHASHLTANCEMLENGRPVMDKRGSPVVKAFILKKEEVEVLDGWNHMGMIATGSHAFRTEGLRIPSNRCFEIHPKKVTLDRPIYRYPFLQLAESTLAVNILGIAFHLLELIEEAFRKRHVHRKYNRKHLAYFRKRRDQADKKLGAARILFYEKVQASWSELEDSGGISPKTLKSVSLASRKLVRECRRQSAVLCPFAGLEIARTHTELNRVWRDFYTVGQHALLIFPF